MITYRPYQKKDFDKVLALCKDNKIEFPSDGTLLFVAEKDDGSIVGIAGLVTLYFAEPLISNNPVAANNLGRMIEGAALSNNIVELNAIVDSNNAYQIQQLEKANFTVTEKNINILTKSWR